MCLSKIHIFQRPIYLLCIYTNNAAIQDCKSSAFLEEIYLEKKALNLIKLRLSPDMFV